MEIAVICLMCAAIWFCLGYLVLELWKMSVVCLDVEIGLYRGMKPTAKIVVRVIVFLLWPLALLFILLLFFKSMLPEMSVSIKQMFTED